jgi:hypothetical protein
MIKSCNLLRYVMLLVFTNEYFYIGDDGSESPARGRTHTHKHTHIHTLSRYTPIYMSLTQVLSMDNLLLISILSFDNVFVDKQSEGINSS